MATAQPAVRAGDGRRLVGNTLLAVKVLPLLFAAAAAAWAVQSLRRGRRLLAAALLVVAALLAVYGSGAIELPSLEELLEDLGASLGGWTYLLVGALAFLETSAFVGLVAPGELAVVFGGFVAGQGRIDPFVLFVIVWIGAAGGDSTGYLLGRRLGRGWALEHGERVGVTPARFEYVERFFQRHGGKTIVIGRFIGFLRAMGPFVAGASRVPYGRFLLASIVGSGLWAATFVTLGYVFWRSFDRALEIAKQGNVGIFIVFVVAATLFGLYRLKKDPELRQRARAWVSEQLARIG